MVLKMYHLKICRWKKISIRLYYLVKYERLHYLKKKKKKKREGKKKEKSKDTTTKLSI